MCRKCKEEAKLVDTSALKEQIEQRKNEMFPAPNEVEMTDANGIREKRGNSDTENDGANRNKKPALDAVPS